MTRTLTRAELHALVWSMPMRDAAKTVGVSDVALKKVCGRAAVPTPPQGHWNRVAAGKAVIKAALPLRPPGMSDEIQIGGVSYGYRQWTREELLGPIPPPPEFDESLEALRARIEAGIGKVVCPRRDGAQSPVIRKLWDQEEARKRKAAADGYVYSWNAPRFDTPLERRRLAILNSLFLAVARFGGKADVRGEKAREISVAFERRHVNLLHDRSPTGRRSQGKSDPDGLTLSILPGYGATEAATSWSDDAGRLETRMTTIAAEVVLAAEIQLRESAVRLHEWRIERKAAMEEEDRLQAAERVRLERERLERLEAARVDALLGAAEDFRKAWDIRSYVSALGASLRSSGSPRQAEYADWSRWALAQADRIDPAVNGVFSDPVDEARPAEIETGADEA